MKKYILNIKYCITDVELLMGQVRRMMHTKLQL